MILGQSPKDEEDSIVTISSSLAVIDRLIEINQSAQVSEGYTSIVEEMLRDSTFYMPVRNDEKAAVYAAMARNFRGTGHWYYCENGHPFTVGECGMPMETLQGPQCGSPVGGRDHEAIGGVTRATDLEEQFGAVSI